MNSIKISVSVRAEDAKYVLSDMKVYMDVINPESETYRILKSFYSGVEKKLKAIDDWTNITSEITHP